VPELGSAVFTIKTNAVEFFGDLKAAEAKANAAARQMGASFRKMAGGADDVSESVDDANEQLTLFGDTTARTTKETERNTQVQRRNRDETRKSTQEFTGLWKTLLKVNIAFSAFGKIIRILKIPAIISGVSALLTVVNALAAGLVGLTASVSAAAPALVSLVQGFASAKQAISVFKLGISGVSDALKDVKKNFAQPTAAAKQFAGYLATFVPDLKRLRSEAQKPILAGLTKGLSEAKSLLPIVHQAVRGTARQLAGLEVQAGKTLSALGPELHRVLNTNVTLIGNLGRGGINLAAALVHILDAGRPLTKWLGKMVEGWTDGVREWAKAGNESGRLTKTFEHTRVVLTHLFSIAGALTQALSNIFHAAMPLGDDMLASIDKLTEHWAKWTGSVAGQNALTKWFNEARPILHETWLLIHDITVALFNFGDQAGVADIIKQLRVGLLPVLVQILRASSNSGFLKALIQLISDLGTALMPLIGSSGPLILFVKGLDFMTRQFIALQQSAPQAAQALAVVGNSMAIISGLGMASALSNLFGFQKGLSAITGAAMALNKVLPILKVEIIGETAAVTGLNTAFLLNPFVLATAAIIALGAAFFIAYKKSETFRNVVQGVLAWIKTAFADTLGWVTNAFHNTVAAVTGAVDAVKKEIDKWKLLGMAVKAYMTMITTEVKVAWAVIKGIFTAELSVLIGITKFYAKTLYGVFSGLWEGVKTIFSGAWIVIKGIVQGGFEILSGIVKIFEGIFRGDWHRVWEGVQQVFHGAITALTGYLKGTFTIFKGIGEGIGKALYGGLNGAISGVKDLVVGLINGIIDVINILPGVDIKHVGGGGKSPVKANTQAAAGQGNLGGSGHLARGGNWGRGGTVTEPTVIMGEEAPTHPEWVIPENPAYRKRAIGLWATAGKRIGAYAQGGVMGAIGSAASSVGDLVNTGLHGLSGLLPHNPLTGAFSGLGSYILHAAGGWLGKQIGKMSLSGGGGAKGPNGVGSFMGIQMADWVIDSLRYAQSKGVNVRPTSGYRPGFDPHTATGKSEHQGTQYPHGAVDFGGYHDPNALAMKMAVVGATSDYKYPLLAPAGFVDDGHASGTGHAKGGVFGKGSIGLAFKQGGVYSREDLMKLWDQHGGAQGRANIAAAVALAESSGRVNASNRNSDGSIDRGLWQINSVHGALSTFAPGGNVDAAIKISSNGTNWNPWTVYRTGAYKQFMGGTLKNPPAAGADGGSGGVGGTAPAPITEDQARMGALNLGYDKIMARQTYGGTGRLIKPVATVPKAQRTNLLRQESMLSSQYQSATHKVATLKKHGASRRAIFEAQGNAQTALQNLNQIRDTIKGVNQQFAAPTKEDKISASIAEGQVTGDIDKQVKGLKEMVDLRQKAYNKAVKGGKPQDIITAAQALVQARGDLQSIMDQISGPTELDRANAALAQAGLTDAIGDDIAALQTLDKLYYDAYQTALAGGDPRKIAEAAGNYAQVHQQLQSITPTAMDYANASLAQAQLTDDWHDDITALTAVDKAAYDAYQAALATGDPKKIAEAAGNYKSAHDALTQATPTAMDYANAQMAQAALTEDITDDITAATTIFDITKKAYDDAVASGDPRRIAQAAQDYKAAQDALTALQNSGTPTSISFGNVIDPGVLAAMGVQGAEGTVGGVTVQQYFQNPPDDPYAYMRSSSFAAQGVFGGG
jgi:uncharacterized membrane protein YuzA (DUF378 family)